MEIWMASNTYLLFEASSLVCRCRWVSFLTLLVTFFGFHVSFREFQKKMDFKVRPDYHKRLEPLKIYHYWIPFSVSENPGASSFWASFFSCHYQFGVDIHVAFQGYLDLTSWILMQKVSDWTKLRISPTFLDPRRDWVVSCLYMLSQCCPCVFLDLVHRNVTNLAETFPRKLKEFPADRTGQFLYPSTLRSKQMALYPLTFSALVHQKIAIVLSYFDPLV